LGKKPEEKKKECLEVKDERYPRAEDRMIRGLQFLMRRTEVLRKREKENNLRTKREWGHANLTWER
jgi:hypothetical protein